METQTITVMIYPPFRKPEEWSVDAYIFGIWAVHEPHKEDDWGSGRFDWSITHVPTGRLAFVANKQGDALEAARRLAVMDEPTITAMEDVQCSEIVGGHEVPSIEPLSIAWIKVAADALDGLEIWATPANEIVALSELYDHLRSRNRYKPQFATAD